MAIKAAVVDRQLVSDLFDSVCDRTRGAACQSNQEVLRQARLRLERDAGDRTAMYVMAASALMADDPRRAFRWLSRPDMSYQEDVTGNRLAAYVSLACDDVEHARVCFDRAVRMDPRLSDCWLRLGQIAQRRGQFRQAATCYERGALFEDRAHQNTLAHARLCVRQKRLKDAIHLLRVCLLRDQRSPQVNLRLAKLLQRRAMQLGRTRQFAIQQRVREEALACCRVVNAAAPSAGSWILQGRLEQQLHDFDGARRSFQQAVDQQPDSAMARSFLAGALVDFGDLDAAIAQFKASLQRDSNHAGTHFRYTRAKRFQPGRESRTYVKQLETKLAVENQSLQRLVYWHYSLAKVYDDTADHDRAWRHYQAANRLKLKHGRTGRRSKTTIENGTLLSKVAEHCEAVFTEDFFRRHRDVGSSDTTPIFIVGMPRSGTTLTEQILSSHRDVAGAGELQYINQIRYECGKIRPDLFSPTQWTASATPKELCPADVQQMLRSVDGYLTYLDRFRSGHRHVTDKMPTNFMHLGYIGLLFPGATVIHCRRDPMDVIVSCFCQNLNPPFCDLEAMVEYYRSYRRMMDWWQQVLPIKIHTVEYESLTADPETHVRNLVEHCGLAWDGACLEFHANGRAVHTPSKWQVRQPMYRSSVGKWRRFEKHLRSVADQCMSVS